MTGADPKRAVALNVTEVPALRQELSPLINDETLTYSDSGLENQTVVLTTRNP